MIDSTWPWYRNFFHRGENNKYRKYIGKYNLSRLFTTRDVIPEFGTDHSDRYRQEMESFLNQIGQTTYLDTIWETTKSLDELKAMRKDQLKNKFGIHHEGDRHAIAAALEKLNNPDRQVNHA